MRSSRTNNAIRLSVGGKGGVGGEDKSFATTKQTVITAAISGAQLQLADLRPESEVILKLATDQKAATRITVQGE